MTAIKRSTKRLIILLVSLPVLIMVLGLIYMLGMTRFSSSTSESTAGP